MSRFSAAVLLLCLSVPASVEGGTPVPVVRPLDLADIAAPVFTNFSARDGLPDRVMLDVRTDRDGFVWAASPLGVTVSPPGAPVELPAAVAAELLAAVRACLDNVAVHVGSDAQAWVLLEDAPERVTVTVRDEGPGIAPDRLVQAEADGRLGVSQSIVGRLAELGGAASLDTGPYGTEWELVVPR